MVGGRAWWMVALAALALPAPAGAAGSLEQVGHSPIGSRGMNSALAIHGDHAYVGSRSDGGAPKGGVAVLDISDPSSPEVVHTIGPPDEGEPGLSSRELRVWPRAGLLIVLRFACEAPQTCADYGAGSSYRFYDIRGENAARPRLVATYEPSRVPHEFFLWEDPKRPGRALLYMSTLTEKGGDDLLVTDISRAREGVFQELTSWQAGIKSDDGSELDLHSLSVSPDGRRGYLAHLAAGFMVIDTSELADARPQPVVRALTPVANRAMWGAPGAHSALPLPGRNWALTTDEVYGSTLGVAPALGVKVAIGCPWGWTRLIDVADPARPRVRGEYKVSPYNDREYCTEERRLQSEQATFSSHNPTVTQDLAFITWHSAGLRAVDLSDPAAPRAVADFQPPPLPGVATEDPTFSTGPDKLVFWSYPIVKDGLIYVVDIRNGLYVLRYRGPHSGQVSCASFLEGNSNLGQGGEQCPFALPDPRATSTRGGHARVRVSCTTRDAAGCSTRLTLR
ncbi:MAG: hypothetical protein M3340_12515, partial [Actinomycetota bacterium]|nr:hypothetical protein [Actinomycetota bacterium]